MIKISYVLHSTYNAGTEEAPKYEDVFTPVTSIFKPSVNLEKVLAKIKERAYNGEYTIEDDGVEEISTPSQLDIIEAQVAYTAMMTDTLLEA